MKNKDELLQEKLSELIELGKETKTIESRLILSILLSIKGCFLTGTLHILSRAVQAVIKFIIKPMTESDPIDDIISKASKNSNNPNLN